MELTFIEKLMKTMDYCLKLIKSGKVKGKISSKVKFYIMGLKLWKIKCAGKNLCETASLDYFYPTI